MTDTLTLRTPTHGTVRGLVGGVPLQGARAPVMLLVHGSGGDADAWEPVLPYVQAITAIAVDLPGRGASDAPRLDTAATYAAFLDEVRAALRIERIAVAGQSLGGGIAQHYGVDFERHCLGIVAANSACDFNISDERLRAIDEDWQGCVQTYGRGQVSERASGALKAAARATVARRDRAAFQDDLRVCNRFDSKPWLHRLRVPLLVIVGRDDPLVVPPRSHAIYERVPHAQMIELAPCGHSTMLEQPRRFARELEDFTLRCAAAYEA